MKLAFWNAGSRVFLNVERTSYKEKDPAYIFHHFFCLNSCEAII